MSPLLLALIGGLYGFMLYHMGFPLNTWEYWVMIGLLIAAIITA